MSRGFRKFDSLMRRESLRWSEEAENVLYYYIMPIYAIFVRQILNNHDFWGVLLETSTRLS